jgi:hypothetical protein
MKMFAFLVAIVLFLGGLALFGYAFAFVDPWRAIAFVGGILAVSVSLMIPFHFLGRAES